MRVTFQVAVQGCEPTALPASMHHRKNQLNPTPSSTERIFIFYPFLSSFGGIERLLIDFHLECRSLGIRTALVCFRNAIDFSGYCGPLFEVHELQGARSFSSEFLRLGRWSKGLASSDRVLVMEMCGAIYGCALQCKYALHIADTPDLLPRDVIKYSFSAGIPALVSRDRPSVLRRLKGELTFRLVRHGVHGATNRVTMTNRNRTLLESTFGCPFVASPPGIAAANSGDSPGDKTCVFLSVCRLELTKRVDWIIRAFAKLPPPLRQNARLEIVGEGSASAHLKATAAECNVESQVIFRGHVSEAELEDCYHEASVFVMPARQGYGLPGLESLARGLRLIVHRESGVSELLESCERAVLIDDENSLADAMGQMCSSHLHTRRKSLNLRTRDQWCREILEHCRWATGT